MNLDCGIRCDSAGVWSALNDSAHQPIGVSWVQTMSDRVRVHYQTPITLVHGGGAESDETYARHGIVAGASVGLVYADVYLVRDTDPVPRPWLNPAGLYIPNSNVWVRVNGT